MSFKVGDKVVCILESDSTNYPSEFNKIYIVTEESTDNGKHFKIDEHDGVATRRFRLANTTELRYHEGFKKELQDIINDG